VHHVSGLAEIGDLVGDPARAAMLWALMDGRAFSAGELADIAGVAPQTASGHLARLLAADLLAVERQGRHRYHRLASPRVAEMLEAMLRVSAGSAAASGRGRRVGPRDEAMRTARTSYDHLAGRLALALADAIINGGHLELDPDGGRLTEGGIVFLRDLGVRTAFGGPSRRPFCRPCLDWSERRPHLAGALGVALADRCLELDWVRRRDGTRALMVTPAGLRGFRTAFDVDLTIAEAA